MIEPVTVRQARKSAFVVAMVLSLLTASRLYRGQPFAAGCFGLACAAVVVCAAIPRAAVWFHRRWLALAEALGYVNSRVLLSAIFFLVLLPTGLISRLVGHDPLERRKPGGGSYWRRRQSTRQVREAYERAF